jgi:hypothetical protein
MRFLWATFGGNAFSGERISCVTSEEKEAYDQVATTFILKNNFGPITEFTACTSFSWCKGLS